MAAAGPAVSLAIAAILFPLSDFSMQGTAFPGQNLITHLCIGNLILVVFNAIPALPMDGGRILRAALQLLGCSKATIIAARISQILSACLIMGALYYSHAVLTVIGILIFTQASQELMREKTSTAIAGLLVRDIMIDRVNVETLSHGMSVAEALTCIMKSFQDFFPVIHGDTVVGIIGRDEILKAAASGENTNYIAEYMNRDFVSVHPNDFLSDILNKLSFRSGYPVLVFDADGFAGLLLHDAVAELLFLQGFNDKNTNTDSEA